MTTSARPRRVRDLFERAVDVPVADLDGWLRREASDDDAVRVEVRSLLDYHSRADRFLERPVVERYPELVVDQPPLSPGAVVGGYTIAREIGRGGMGRVYLARDNRLGRDVALKVLAPHLTGDPVHRERLRREARAAAALTHPGICTVYALEEIDDALYIASELVDGRTLREEMAAGRPSPERLVQTCRELAAALASAHAQGIAHRDLKPENVMRTRDGRIKVLDFGLARFADSGTGRAAAAITQPGLLMGTPAYMAPEQLSGLAADARADVFAFGVLMYEYACGEHPFAAPTELGLVARVLEGEARPLAGRGVALPASVIAVIERALRKRPGERFASAGAIVEALDRSAEASRLRSPASDPTFGWLPLPLEGWWRTHQAVSMALYVVATIVAWAIKEHLGGGAALWVFVGVGVGAAAAGIARGHLLFTGWMNRRRLATERGRAGTLTRAGDLAITVGLVIDGLLLAPERPLWAMLTIALALGVGLAAFLMEPATAGAVFDDARD